MKHQAGEVANAHSKVDAADMLGGFNLQKTYGRRRVVDDVSIHVNDGAVFAACPLRRDRRRRRRPGPSPCHRDAPDGNEANEPHNIECRDADADVTERPRHG